MTKASGVGCLLKVRMTETSIDKTRVATSVTRDRLAPNSTRCSQMLTEYIAPIKLKKNTEEKELLR